MVKHRKVSLRKREIFGSKYALCPAFILSCRKTSRFVLGGVCNSCASSFRYRSVCAWVSCRCPLDIGNRMGERGQRGRGGVDVPRVFLCFKDELQNTLEQSLRRLMSPLHTTTYNEKYTEREYQPTFNYIRWSWIGKNLIASLSFNKVWKCKKPYKINKRTNKQTNKKQNSQHLQEQQ